MHKRFPWWLALALLGLAPCARAQSTARAVIEKAVQAHGGVEQLAKLKALRIKSKGTAALLPGADPVAFTGETTAQMPGQIKNVMEFDLQGKKHTLVQVIDGDKVADRDWRLRRLVEKPAPGSAPSRLAIIGRYVLPPEIFDILEQTPPGRGGEIQLTDAMAVLCERFGMHGLEVEGRRFDAGDRAGYVLAVLYYALRRKDIGAEVRAGAQRLLDELGRG